VNLFSRKAILNYDWTVVVSVCNFQKIVHFSKKKKPSVFWDRCVQVEINERITCIIFVMFTLHISSLRIVCKYYMVPFIKL
jgi:hypothetical protein